MTDQNLDLSIIGKGFFWMANGTTRALRVTRDGRFKIDQNGDLVHWEQGDQVMKVTENGYSHIRITDAARILDAETGEESTIVSIWATEDAKLLASYTNGEIREVCKLAIMDFNRPRELKRVGQHLFEYDSSNLPKNVESPHVSGNSRELLDETAYLSMGFPRWESQSHFD